MPNMMPLHNNKNTPKNGFTLIELVVVIIILGIIAMIALPKFVDIGRDAKIATVKVTGGAFSSAITLAHMKWAAMGYSGPADNLAIFNQAGTDGQLDINNGVIQHRITHLTRLRQDWIIIMTVSQSGLRYYKMAQVFQLVQIRIYRIIELNISIQISAVITTIYYHWYPYTMIRVTARS